MTKELREAYAKRGQTIIDLEAQLAASQARVASTELEREAAYAREQKAHAALTAAGVPLGFSAAHDSATVPSRVATLIEERDALREQLAASRARVAELESHRELHIEAARTLKRKCDAAREEARQAQARVAELEQQHECQRDAVRSQRYRADGWRDNYFEAKDKLAASEAECESMRAAWSGIVSDYNHGRINAPDVFRRMDAALAATPPAPAPTIADRAVASEAACESLRAALVAAEACLKYGYARGTKARADTEARIDEALAATPPAPAPTIAAQPPTEPWVPGPQCERCRKPTPPRGRDVAPTQAGDFCWCPPPAQPQSVEPPAGYRLMSRKSMSTGATWWWCERTDTGDPDGEHDTPEGACAAAVRHAAMHAAPPPKAPEWTAADEAQARSEMVKPERRGKLYPLGRGEASQPQSAEPPKHSPEWFASTDRIRKSMGWAALLYHVDEAYDLCEGAYVDIVNGDYDNAMRSIRRAVDVLYVCPNQGDPQPTQVSAAQMMQAEPAPPPKAPEVPALPDVIDNLRFIIGAAFDDGGDALDLDHGQLARIVNAAWALLARTAKESTP